MTLHETLQALVEAKKITAEDVNTINSQVTSIKASAIEKITADFEAKITGMESKNKELTDKLAPILEKEKGDKLSAIVSGLTDDDKLADAIALANLEEDDTDEVIKDKVSKVIESRSYLQKTEVSKDDTVVKTIGEGPQPTEVEPEEPTVSHLRGI